MRITRLLLFLFAALTAASASFAQKRDENSYLKIANVRYATHTHSDPSLNMLNVYMPKKGSNSPMVVWVHGGSLAYGDKDNVLHKAEYFTARGYVFVSINYRVSPAVKHPANAQDVADALVWLHENARHYSSDPENIFLIGHSNGADLAALVTLDDKYFLKAGGSSAILDGVVLLDGTGYDLSLLMKSAGNKMKEWYTESYGKTKKEWDQASVINFVKADSGAPPFLIAYADDQEPSQKQAITLSKKLSEAGIKNTVFHYEKKTSNSINKELGRENDKPTEDVYRFLQEIHYIAVNPIK
ncbi:MAG TPA: alpha/beta hydrolase [Cyclobacteriaceae bacterium]|nr:alpha/beta hydrolase [Cyclobacteriaceae bacterium]